MYAENDKAKQEKLKFLAECALDKQHEIQQEITRRH